jgi:hypothetical protein
MKPFNNMSLLSLCKFDLGDVILGTYSGMRRRNLATIRGIKTRVAGRPEQEGSRDFRELLLLKYLSHGKDPVAI